jgi:type II secretory pathway pseudopilin PulG
MYGEDREIAELQSRPFWPGRRGCAKGVALLNLLGLMVLLVIMLVVIVATASWVRQSGRESLTRRTLESLSQALAMYEESAGDFPPAVSSNAELVRHLGSLESSGQVLKAMPAYAFRHTPGGREILDGWGRPLRYALSGTRAELISEGRHADDHSDDVHRSVPKSSLPEGPN